MSIALFQRGMAWRKEANARLEKRRQELVAEGKARTYTGGAATVGDHIDSYWNYRRLSARAMVAPCCARRRYTELKTLARNAAKNRLYVTWRNTQTGMDCYCIRPDSRCFCGHSYKAHAWYNTESKRVHCRCDGCPCEGFEYVTGHGAWWIKCVCKHGHDEHYNGRGRCGHEGCECRAFHSSFSCVCGSPWADHATVIETRSERKRRRLPTDNLCGGGGAGEAACGAITRMSSLVPGIDRIETPLPFTDAGFFAHRLPSGDGAHQRVRCSSMRCRKSHSTCSCPCWRKTRQRPRRASSMSRTPPPRARVDLLPSSRGTGRAATQSRRADPAMASDEPLP